MPFKDERVTACRSGQRLTDTIDQMAAAAHHTDCWRLDPALFDEFAGLYSYSARWARHPRLFGKRVIVTDRPTEVAA